ncbi:FdhF/YdeP family oxidoreductase [Negadavirga shengliensis]|uniref:FdhF/YdeP family oxidoreductase n=1 Tax=Negadavirga shengliensis TaxID=1389218 RepID=A0ABV9SXH2_9BACT
MGKPSKTKTTPIPKVAAGLGSLKSVAYHIWEETYVGRGVKTLFKLNQPRGFDCPSCAWPDPDAKDVSKIGEYCENGAKAVAWEATNRKAGPDFFKQYSVAELFEKSDHWLEKQGRLTHPMVLQKGDSHYRPISWEEAFDLLARQLNGLDHPDQALFYTSGRTSNEAAFLYQCFVRQFGTNNLPDCSNMCHEASGKALKETVGIGKASVTLEDIPKAELLMIIGQNPGTNAPRMLTSLQQLKKNGGKIIAVNPLPEAGFMGFRHPQKPWEWIGKGTPIQDLYLQVAINGDLPLLKALLKILLEEDEDAHGQLLDHDFIAQNTEGFPELKQHLKALSLDDLITASGVSEEKLREAAWMIRDRKKVIIAWAMGVTQHRNAEDTIREIVNLLLVKGAIGIPGAGTLPVRGHSNVQGDRTMGICEKMPKAFLDKLGEVFSFEPPRKPGVGAVGAVQAMLKGEAKVFFGMGGNFAMAAPDTSKVFEALRSCELTAYVSTKLNRGHLVHGKTALILPCLGRTERDETENGAQFVSTEDTAGRIRMSQGDLPPASEHLKSEVAIVCSVAKTTLGSKSSTDWQALGANYDLVRQKIEAVIPGFENYNGRVRIPGGFYLPNCAREGRFETDSGKAKITVNPLPQRDSNAGEFVLMTVRSHDQFNTTVYGLNDRYRNISNTREVVMMHETDIEKIGAQPGDKVRITSYFKNEQRILENFKAVSYDIAPGCVAVYFPEGNVLVALDNKSGESHCPASKYVDVTIEKMG